MQGGEDDSDWDGADEISQGITTGVAGTSWGPAALHCTAGAFRALQFCIVRLGLPRQLCLCT